MILRLICVGAALALPTLALAQDPTQNAATKTARAALSPIARIVGQWEGEATISTGPGESMTVRQSENIEWAADSSVIIIRGTGRSTQAADKGRIVFEAAAFMWYDADSSKVKMRTFSGGRSVDARIAVRPDTVVWGFPVPGGEVRYTIAVDDERWHETGEFVRTGAPPVRTIELLLKRVAK